MVFFGGCADNFSAPRGLRFCVRAVVFYGLRSSVLGEGSMCHFRGARGAIFRAGAVSRFWHVGEENSGSRRVFLRAVQNFWPSWGADCGLRRCVDFGVFWGGVMLGGPC
jgi:hypothetical protein